MKQCVLFDFDGTITTTDTTKFLLWAFLKKRPLYTLRVIPKLFSFLLSSSPLEKEKIKNDIIGYAIKGYNEVTLLKTLDQFEKLITSRIRKKMNGLILNHLENNNIVVIVSASPTFVLQTVFSDSRLILIGTQFEKNNNIYTGKIIGASCFGAEKPLYIKRWASQARTPIQYAEAWSDSISDLPMMQLAHRRFWIAKKKKQTQIMASDPEGIFVDIDSE